MVYIYGDSGDNTLSGTDLPETLDGGAGNDFLFGGGGSDRVFGRDGDDYIVDNLGNDSLFGGNGNDTLSGRDGNDYISGDDGNDKISGNNGDDYLRGSYGNDSLEGFSGDDTIVGGSEDDLIRGDYTLFGVAGNDSLIGGLGADTIDSSDIFWEGKDTFRYNSTLDSTPSSRDSIGFQVGTDKIDLSLIDSNNNVSGNQAFDFIGTKSFYPTGTNDNGQLRYDAANNLIQAEINGDGDMTVDLEIKSLIDLDSLSKSDFIM